MTGGWAFKGEINNVAEIRDYIKTMRQTNPQPKVSARSDICGA